MDVSGFLMMSHMTSPEALAAAKMMEDYGAHCVYVTDSGGAMNMDDYAARLQAYDRVLKLKPAGSMRTTTCRGVANSLIGAERRGARRCLACRDGRGRAPLEVFIAAADRYGWNHGCDLYALMDAADELVRPLQDRPCRWTAKR
jgi:4-hydroxy 2-oxovalerate aldolase